MVLTKAMRAIILKRLMTATFDVQLKAIEERKQDFMEVLYLDHYAKWLDAMAMLPDRFLDTALTMEFNVNGITNPYRSKWLFRTSKPVANAPIHKDAHYPEGHPFVEIVKFIFDDEELIIKEKDKAKVNAIGVLDSVRTLKKLLEVWPEIEPYTDGLGPQKVGFPAVQIKTVNAMFGLPV